MWVASKIDQNVLGAIVFDLKEALVLRSYYLASGTYKERGLVRAYYKYAIKYAKRTRLRGVNS